MAKTTIKPAGKTTTKRTTRTPATKKLSMNEKLFKLIQEVKKDEHKEQFNDTFYTKVSTRKLLLREEFGFDVKIITVLKEHDPMFSYALFEAQIKVLHEKTKEWETVANGYSYEVKNSSELNLHNFIENAETSAIGRALSNLGVDGGLLSDAELKKQENKTKKGETVTIRGKGTSVKKGGISEDQIKEISELAKNIGYEIKHILKEYKASKIEDLTSDEGDKIIEILKAGTEDDVI